MMDWLREWLQNIIVIVLLATFADLLLPNSNLQKYSKMVLGLLIVFTILTPILTVFDQFDMNQIIQEFNKELDEPSSNSKKGTESLQTDMQQNMQSKMITQVEQMMNEQLQELVNNQYNVDIKDLRLETSFSDGNWKISKIEVTVQEKEEAEAAGKDQTEAEVENIKMVSITLDQSPVSSEKKAADQNEKIEKEIIRLIQSEWGFPKNNIFVYFGSG